MITASTDLKNVLKNNTAVQISSGCFIEYNINDMINSPTVTSSYAYTSINGYKPFTNIFPYSSIVEPIRPEKCGIKYVVIGDSQIVTKEYRDPKTIKYGSNFRTYFPGIDNRYKYFLSNQNEAIGLSISYAKTFFTNKVVVKFELGHSTPTSGTVTLKLTGSTVATISFTSADIKAFGQNNAGAMTVYYTGSTWSKLESDLNTSAYVSINQIDLSVPAVSGKKYIGVIEVSPKYVLDISNDIQNFDIQTESSSGNNITPVGLVTANSLSINFNKFDKTTLKTLVYDKLTTSFTADRLYLYKNARLTPHFKIYHSAGAYGTSPNKYDIVNQGTFFINNWTIGQTGDVYAFALDGAKVLQDTICPDILCEQFSMTAILRYLLDSIGFTNYNFNMNPTDTAENGIISPRFWWAEDNTTVWEAIQEICTDAQMIATFDNQNILQFYTRDYLYNSSRTEDWTFYYQQNTPSDPLPNILSLNKTDLPSGNKVRILWNSITSTRYEQDGAPLWKSPKTWLTTAALNQNILSTAGEGSYMALTPITSVGSLIDQDWFFSFAGYVMIDSEIIEYDAIQFQYKDDVTKLWTTVDISNTTDSLKYRSYSEPGPGNFVSTGKYRIKTRGAFSTGPAVNHYVDQKNTVSGWTSVPVVWS